MSLVGAMINWKWVVVSERFIEENSF